MNVCILKKFTVQFIEVVLLFNLCSTDLAQEKSPVPELIKNEPQTPEETNDSVANPFLHENPSNSLLDSELLNDMADTVSSLGEPSLASLGLGGYSPTGLIQQALELIHVQGNLSWCLSIAFFTVIVRVVCLPLIIKAQANTAKMNNIRPQLEEAQAKLRELANSHDSVAKATASMKLSQLYKDNDCHPLKVHDHIFQTISYNIYDSTRVCVDTVCG